MDIKWNLLGCNDFVVLDLETTGFSVSKMAKIIEIGAVKYIAGKEVGTFSTFVNPELKISAKITAATGITNDMVKDAPVISDVIYKFREFIGNCVIVAHNAKFDWDRFLVPIFKMFCIYPKNEVVDTMEISKATFSGKNVKHNLEDLCNRLEILCQGHHRAINDALMTAQAYLKLRDLNKDKIPECYEMSHTEASVLPYDFNVVRVNHWETKNTRKLTNSRQYITLRKGRAYGSVYYDALKDVWMNKDFPEQIDLLAVQDKVLKFLSLNTKEDLKNYK